MANRSNADLSDEELSERSLNGGNIIDSVTAGFALNNRKKAREKSEVERKINSIPNRHKEYR